MLRIKLMAVVVLTALGLVVWWLWSAGMSEPAVAKPAVPATGAVPEVRLAGGASAPGPSSSQPGQQDIWAGVHQPPGTPGDDLEKKLYGVSAQDVAKVQRALAGAEPAEALSAAHLLERCANSDAEVRGLFEARDQQPWFLSKLGLGVDKMIANAQAFQRDCQALDAAARARTGDLYQQAYAGGAPNSALPYLRWLQREGSEAPAAALVTDLQRQIRTEAEAADFGTLMAVALTHDPQGLGLSDVDKAGFERAWVRTQEADMGQEQMGKTWGRLLNLLKLLGDKPPELTPAQEAQAQALSERVFAVWQRRKQALR